MDLALYARVLLRHRQVLLVGVVLAFVLAIFSHYRVEMGIPPKLTPRKAEVWQSSASLLLTQRSQVVPVPGIGDPGSLANLAGLYARLAMSDEVLRRMKGGSPGGFRATALVDRDSESVLPAVALLGTGSTPREARTTVARGLEAFLAYVRTQQGSVGISKRSRVELRVLNSPQPAQLLEPRKRTLPIVVFLSVLIAAIASAFILENRRRSSLLAEVEFASVGPEKVELRPSPQGEVELSSAVLEEVELGPAPQGEAELRPAPHSEVAARSRPEDEIEPDRPTSSVRRWA